MPHILEMPAFMLKNGVSESDFLRVHDKWNREFMSKQDGYVSHTLIRNGDTWFDLAIWDSMEAKEKAFKDIYENAATTEYISLIDSIGTDEEIPIFTVVKTY